MRPASDSARRADRVSEGSARCKPAHLVDLDLALAQLHLGLFNLLLEFGVSLGNVVESENRDTQASEKVAGKDNQGVEGKLECVWVSCRHSSIPDANVRTTGIISVWTVSFRGTRPRKRDK